jgi:hypothetical protein
MGLNRYARGVYFVAVLLSPGDLHGLSFLERTACAFPLWGPARHGRRETIRVFLGDLEDEFFT